MKADFRRAVSFVLVLLLCAAGTIVPAAAAGGTESDVPLTGVQVRPDTGIEAVTDISIGEDGRLHVTGTLTATWGGVVCSAIHEASNAFLKAGPNTAADDENFSVSIGLPNNFEGYFYVVLGDTDNTMISTEKLSEEGYKVLFQVADGQVVTDPTPPWDEVHGDAELSITPQAVTLADSIYGLEGAAETLMLKNTGWNRLNNITAAAVSADGGVVSLTALPELLGSGAVSDCTVTADTTLTPGSYSVELQFTSDELGAASAAAVSVDFTVLKATQAAVTGWGTEAAAEQDGMGRITGLTGGAVYELGVTPFAEADWTEFTAEADGTYTVTPGTYRLRLPGSDYLEPGESTSDVVVGGFYHFTDTTISDMKADTDINYPVCDLVSGGVGTKTFAITGAGVLPPGLTLSADGYITGSATVVTDSSFLVQIQVTDENPTEADRIQTGTITIAGIAMGDQPAPAAPAVAAADTTLTIGNWAAEQEYAATTSTAITETDLSWTHWEADDTSAKVLTGLSPNKQYIVFSRLMATSLKNPSPATTAAAMTARTTIASVTISGSGLVNGKLEAVISPAAATADYSWKNGAGTVLSSTSSLTVTDAIVGETITLRVDGTGDYQGELTTEPYMVGGRTITVKVSSYDPKKPVTAVLESQDKTLSFAAISVTGAGVGACVQTVTLEGIHPNTTYDLTLSKAGHTSLSIKGIVLESSDLTITSAGAVSVLKLFCGDFSGDGAVRLEDRAMLLQSKYYGRSTGDFSDADADMAAMLDIDGDGAVKFSDLAILMSAENYGKTGVSIDY